jgi:hypothetical protein
MAVKDIFRATMYELARFVLRHIDTPHFTGGRGS